MDEKNIPNVVRSFFRADRDTKPSFLVRRIAPYILAPLSDAYLVRDTPNICISGPLTGISGELSEKQHSIQKRFVRAISQDCLKHGKYFDKTFIFFGFQLLTHDSSF